MKEGEFMCSCPTAPDGEARLCQCTTAMPDDEQMWDMAELFKIFGDSTRIRILYSLLRAGDCACGNPQCRECHSPGLCVCDLAARLNMSQPAISYQLRILKQAKLVKNRRVGKQICYALADGHVQTILRMAREHLEE